MAASKQREACLDFAPNSPRQFHFNEATTLRSRDLEDEIAARSGEPGMTQMSMMNRIHGYFNKKRC
jgi:hypothetical protein